MRTLSTIGSILLLLLLGACGGKDAAGGSKADRTRAALETLFAAVRADDMAAAAQGIAYRGDDPKRAFRSTYDRSDETEALQLKMAVDEVKHKLGDGEVSFVEFRSETESEGEWLAWQVKTSKGTYWFACLDVDGRILLGDID